MFIAMDQSGKMPSVWRSPATSATRSSTGILALSPRRPEKLHQHGGLAVTAETGETDHLATIGDKFTSVRAARGPGFRPWRVAAALERPASSCRLAGGDHRPHAATSASRLKSAAGRSATPCRRAGRRCDPAAPRISPSRCEMRMTVAAAADEPRTKSSNWPATMSCRARKSARRE